jgi:hypothetical protein
MTLCPWEDRPANGGRRIKREKRRKAAAILKIWSTDLFPLSNNIGF